MLITYVAYARDNTVAISVDGRKIGLTPTFTAFRRLDTLAAVTPPAIIEVGLGQYKFLYDPETTPGTVIEIGYQIDFGATLPAASDRYQDGVCALDSSRVRVNLDAALSAAPTATATALLVRPVKAGLTLGQLLVTLVAADAKVCSITNTWNAATHILTTSYQFPGDTGPVLTTTATYPATQVTNPVLLFVAGTIGTVSQP